MSMTLGEKLRQAREERGVTLSEVAEQTRISPQYIESIEHDDYRSLPGGIFNKGFVKSFAKYVGVNEQEALADYADLFAETTTTPDDEFKAYKPEVLTDDRTGSSMVPTVIVAIVILALMTAGILFLVNYLRQPTAPPAANLAKASNSNTVDSSQSEANTKPSNVPDMATLKVDFKALNQPVPLTVTIDEIKSDKNVAAGSAETFNPKESLTLNYNKWNADKVQLTINGKTITLPSSPLNSKDKRIEFTISKENIGQIWQSGAISTEVPRANPEQNNNAVTAPPTSMPTPVRSTPPPKPSVAANTATNSAIGPKPSATVKVLPTPKGTVITIPPANRPH